MLEHFCECYSDLRGLILCPMLGSITPLFIYSQANFHLPNKGNVLTYTLL